VHEARVDVDVREEAEEEGEGDGVEGVVWGGGCGGHACCCLAVFELWARVRCGGLGGRWLVRWLLAC
jgi:hypothetical protein